MSLMRGVFALAGTLMALGTAQGANAADLYGGGMKDAPYVQTAAPSQSGWYVRADGSWASYNIDDVSIVDLALTGLPVSTFTNATSDIDSGWSIGAGIGRYFGNGFRGDLTLEYRGKTDLSGSVAGSCCTEISTDTEVDGVVGLANLYYDFNRGGRFVPYIGGGLGFAHLETNGGTLACTVGCTGLFGAADYDGSSTTNFAVAAMAGLTWKIRGGETTYMPGMKDEPVAMSSGRALYLDVGYRFLYLGDVDAGTAVQASGNQLEVGWDDLTAHEIRAGLRYDLN